MLKAKNKEEAWETANQIFPTDYIKDEESSMLEETTPEEEHEQTEKKNLEARRALANRLIKVAFLFAEDLIEDLESKEKEDVAVKKMKEDDDGGQIRCMILTADNNIRVTKSATKETHRIVRWLLQKDNFVEEWMLAGANAILDYFNESKNGISYSLPNSLAGMLGMDW